MSHLRIQGNVFKKNVLQSKPSQCTVIKYSLLNMGFAIYVKIYNTDKIIFAKFT